MASQTPPSPQRPQPHYRPNKHIPPLIKNFDPSRAHISARHCSDNDAITYLPTHLIPWYLPDALWAALPVRMHRPLAVMQHAGAAADTSFERVGLLRAELDGVVTEDGDGESGLKSRTPSWDSIGSLQWVGDDDDDSGRTTPALSSPITPLDLDVGLARSERKFSTGSWAGSPFLPVSFPSPSVCSGSPPLPPFRNSRITAWRAEVATLRGTTLVRLRHAVRAVDGEWRTLLFGMDGVEGVDWEAWEVLIGRFETWLNAKKRRVLGLEELASGLGEYGTMGWSGSVG
ncbi:hypothetical protein BT63DRAFT_408565 [Microthyrium microscopicum]|uniref:Uncharacterized protein n=1 Tax=Microthyrium microscopicum TaxID=703497 RepID=A0A6A6URI5_9PEZI|nr:hypothetical protein BT63DRAFT_408565 [Microthyrium microscopicum]